MWKAGGRKTGRLEQASKTKNEIKRGRFSYIDTPWWIARGIFLFWVWVLCFFVHKRGVGGIFDMILA